MKHLFLLSLLIIGLTTGYAKPLKTGEKFGNTLNIGVGVGYYGYIQNPLPVFTFNYEIDVVHNFTLAPFISFYTYRNDQYGFNNNVNGYTYRETVAPIGIKGAYYFDELFHAHPKWDFYAAASLGFVARRITWDNNYYGSHSVYRSRPLIYSDAHFGTEYHINPKAGLFADISTGVSTVGLAIHF